jgi:hypothetical protein
MTVDQQTILSLSPSPDALRLREATLCRGGLNVFSVQNSSQARFEIEMGRCGVFLLCYRSSIQDADDLTSLFRKFCPEGWIIFIKDAAKKASIPREADIVVSESSGPELILNLLTRRMNAPPSAPPRAA